MARLRIDEVLVILLEHTNRDLVYYICGVLVNLAADSSCNGRLIQLKAVPKLVDLLEDATDDVELLLCTCKVLANLSLDQAVCWVPQELAHLQRTTRGVVDKLTTLQQGESTQQLAELLHHLAASRAGHLEALEPDAQGAR